MTSPAYQRLEACFARLSDIHGAMSILGWDAQVMMPKGASEIRAGQMATLTEIAHDRLLDPQLPELADLARHEPLDAWQRTNLALMQRSLKDAAAIPTDLAAALAKTGMETEFAWRDAREANDYPALMPHFAVLLKLIQESTALRAQAFGLPLYDAALDSYQPGLRENHVFPVFEDLAGFLPALLDKVLSRQSLLPASGPRARAHRRGDPAGDLRGAGPAGRLRLRWRAAGCFPPTRSAAAIRATSA